jgi:hypothetical protein
MKKFRRRRALTGESTQSDDQRQWRAGRQMQEQILAVGTAEIGTKTGADCSE